MEKTYKFCQSCGMPFKQDPENDGTKSIPEIINESCMKLLRTYKKYLLSGLMLWFATPAVAFAINPHTISRHQSIGEIFRGIILYHPFGLLIILGTVAMLCIPAVIISYFVHRKYIAYSFFVIFPIVYFIPLIFNGDTSNLVGSIINFYITIILITIAFFASTLFNKKKKVHRKQDYIPLGIIGIITLILIFFPVRLGHVLCEPPIINTYFDNCDYYLESSKKSNLGWFTF